MSEPRKTPGQFLRKILLRIVTILVVAYLIGFLLDLSNHYLEQVNGPAGFGRGLLNGAMMPAAMPNLAMGKDLSIYAANNNGLPYKLGYTMGVNICGAIFFGIFFVRVSRWKKSRLKAQPEVSFTSK